MSVRVTGSRAPTLSPTPPLVGGLIHVEAAVRGFISDPLHPAQATAKLLASWDRGVDVKASDGRSLRALDAADGNFHVHLHRRRLEDGSSISLSLAPTGDEANAVIETHPHDPRAPVGFHNLDRATVALDEVQGLVKTAAAEPSTRTVDRLRLESIDGRLSATRGYMDTLRALREAHPILGTLAEAREHAYKSEKKGDADDVALGKLVKALEGWLAAGADGLSAEGRAQVREDLDTVAAEQKKWSSWRRSTGLFTLWVRD
jgi:hypothetical protein